MRGDPDLWQKSLGPVTEITRLIVVECELYHGPTCDAALCESRQKPTIGNMSVISGLPANVLRTSRERTSTAYSTGPGHASKGTASPVRLLQVTWEVTSDCEWKAGPARSTSRTRRGRPHSSTAEAFHLVQEISEMRVPLLALTGGDPLLRPDLLPIIEFASARSVRTSLTLLPTPKLEPRLMAELKQAGLMRVGFWIHGSTAALDDRHWGVSGSHRRILDLIGTCHEVQLPVQVNTIVARRNFHDLDPMCELLDPAGCSVMECFLFCARQPRGRRRDAQCRGA